MLADLQPLTIYYYFLYISSSSAYIIAFRRNLASYSFRARFWFYYSSIKSSYSSFWDHNLSYSIIFSFYSFSFSIFYSYAFLFFSSSSIYLFINKDSSSIAFLIASTYNSNFYLRSFSFFSSFCFNCSYLSRSCLTLYSSVDPTSFIFCF